MEDDHGRRNPSRKERKIEKRERVIIGDDGANSHAQWERGFSHEMSRPGDL